MNAMTARCNFCGRTFSSSQGVRAHLKTCTNYQNKKNFLRLPYRQPREPRQLPKEALGKPATRVTAAKTQNYARFHDNAVYLDDEPQKKSQKEEEERRVRQEKHEAERRRQDEYAELRRQKEEQENRQRKRRDTIQAVKQSVIDWYISLSIIPNEIKAKAVLEIERTLGTLPVLDLPRSELIQIAEGIRDETYIPYLKALEVKKSNHEEVMIMGKKQLISGLFWCPDCDAEYELDRADAIELVCDDCGTRLEETDDED